jgi:hypothetical protein
MHVLSFYCDHCVTVWGVVYHFIGDRIPLTGSDFLKHIKKIQLFLNMLLNILKTPKDLQLSK